MKKYLLFDLDGTLTDSAEGIINSVIYALKAYGIEEKDKTSLRKFIGPPLSESFQIYYSFSKEQAEAATAKYREYFGEKGMLENSVYDGIPQLLEKLKENGRKLYVATSKPTFYAAKILAHFGLSQYFEDIQGSNMDGTRVKKAEVITHVLKENNITDPGEVLMIGDREHDVIGGKACGVETMGVLYGFGSRAELEACQADHIAADVKELEQFLMA